MTWRGPWAASAATKASAVSSSATWVVRSSVLRSAREVNDAATMVAMKKEAILMPSGRSMMLAMVV